MPVLVYCGKHSYVKYVENGVSIGTGNKSQCANLCVRPNSCFMVCTQDLSLGQTY